MTRAWTRFAPVVAMAVSVVLGAGTAAAEVRVDVNRELQLIEQGRATQHIPGAAHRVALFTFEDPDKTGLGGALAALAGRTILTSGLVSSLGVIRYEGDLSPTTPGAPAYFDKVETLVASQHVSIAVWGRVQRAGGRLLVDTYLQVPAEMLDAHFTWKLPLPARMGGGELRARLRPSRIAVQRLAMPASDADAVRAAAQALDELRSAPQAGASVQARLPQGQVYTLEEIQGRWVRLRLDAARTGWSPVPSCAGSCSSFLTAGRFAGGMLRYMADRRVPDVSGELTLEARAAADQLRALNEMGRPAGLAGALTVVQRWLRAPVGDASAEAGQSVFTAGPTFANIFALNRTANLLVGAYSREMQGRPGGAASLAAGQLDRETWDRSQPDRAAVRELAQTLARSAVLHPSDEDLLHNLAVLFEYAGDGARAALAREMARTRR